MDSITTLADKLEAAKISGGVFLTTEELDGLFRIKNLFRGEAGEISGAPAKALLVDDPDECITTEELCAKLKITKRTLHRWRMNGTFTPQPVNPQGSRWLLRDLVDWWQEQQS